MRTMKQRYTAGALRGGRRLAWLLAGMLILAWPCAQASGPSATPQAAATPMATERPLSDEQEAEILAALAKAYPELKAEELSQALEDFYKEGTAGVVAGETVGDTYTDPNGFSMKIPEGWTLGAAQIGPMLTLTSPESQSGVTPSITVLVTIAPEGAEAQITRDSVEAQLSEALEGFHLVAVDAFEYAGMQAQEIVCMYGQPQRMLMQYQTHFSDETRQYIITMTTLAEEAMHDKTRDIYDAFLSDFTILEASQGNG